MLSACGEKETLFACRKARRAFARWAAISFLSICLVLIPAARSRAEDYAGYRYGYYREDRGRIEIQTHSGIGEVAVSPNVSLKGEVVYDAISGATPTGAPARGGKVPTVEIDDTRYAGGFEIGLKYKRFTFRPGFSYSDESDYRSIGAALNTSIDFNQKNTTLNLGVAQAWDEVIPTEGTFLSEKEDKNTTDFFAGVTQLLGPKMFVTANFTFGTGYGYFTDPYKGARFDGYPDPDTIFPERRPSHRTKEIVYLSATRYFETVKGSAELSYRFYNDSFGVTANTAGFTWHQKIGEKIVIAPGFRFYDQSEADFYAVTFPGDPSIAGSGVPRHYSADYRLSAFQSFTYGVTVTWKATEHLQFDLGYKRYEMKGTDGATDSSAYPSAHIVSAGLRLWF